MASKRNCYACGSEYEYCSRCSAYADQPKWRWMWDTEECKDIYDVISGYNMGIKTESDIKYVLDKYDITDYSKYNKNIESLLTKLFSNTNSYNSYKKYNKKNKNKEMDIELEQEDKIEEEINVETEEPVDAILSSILNVEGISEE